MNKNLTKNLPYAFTLSYCIDLHPKINAKIPWSISWKMRWNCIKSYKFDLPLLTNQYQTMQIKTIHFLDKWFKCVLKSKRETKYALVHKVAGDHCHGGGLLEREKKVCGYASNLDAVTVNSPVENRDDSIWFYSGSARKKASM